EQGGPEVDEDTAGVPRGPVAPHPLRLHTQAQLVDEPGRDRVRDRHAQGDPAGELHLGGRPAQQDPGLHRLLQPGLCQTVQLDLYRAAPPGVINNWGGCANLLTPAFRGFSFAIPRSRATRPGCWPTGWNRRSPRQRSWASSSPVPTIGPTSRVFNPNTVHDSRKSPSPDTLRLPNTKGQESCDDGATRTFVGAAGAGAGRLGSAGG